MSKHWKAFRQHCFGMFMRAKVMNMKILIKPLRNFKETAKTQVLMIWTNFQFWLNFIVSYKKVCVNSSGCLPLTTTVYIKTCCWPNPNKCGKQWNNKRGIYNCCINFPQQPTCEVGSIAFHHAMESIAWNMQQTTTHHLKRKTKVSFSSGKEF